MITTCLKDKFAGPRIYAACEDDVEITIQATEVKCRNTCEFCGSVPAHIVSGGWIHNACSACDISTVNKQNLRYHWLFSLTHVISIKQLTHPLMIRLCNPLIILIIGLFIPLYSSIAQNRPPITWTCQWNRISETEGMIVITASLAPGWYLYSQHPNKGGPVTTRLDFVESAEFKTIGPLAEHGDPRIYYDSIYEMNIVSYAYEVGFLQKIKLNKPNTTVKCLATYILCGDKQCIPMKETISVPVSTNRKTF